MSQVEDNIKALGLEIPVVPSPQFEYVPWKRIGALIYVSGQGPSRDGKDVYVGKVGSDLTVEQGQQAARLCALNCIACLQQAANGLDNIEQIVQVIGFVNSAPGFGRQPEVMNGGSKLFSDVFGEHGKHTRAALGTSDLPGNIAVEVMVVAKAKE